MQKHCCYLEQFFSFLWSPEAKIDHSSSYQRAICEVRFLGSYYKAPETMSGQLPPDRLDYTHYAIIYINRDGSLCQKTSDSIANSRQNILSPRVTDEFLRAVAMSRELHAIKYKLSNEELVQCSQGPQFNTHNLAPSQGELMACSGMSLGSEPRMQITGSSDTPIQPAMWTNPSESWALQTPTARLRKKDFGGRSLNLAAQQRVAITVKDRDFLRLYYEKVFHNLQQTNCRIIAKAYIKLVEPRKQVNYPYNGRKIIEGQTRQLDPEASKPPWWPPGVSHREPDHLPKVERIRLLVHIFCELRKSHGTTAARLKASDQAIRRQILPVERLQILDEAYRVLEEEQEFLNGVSDGEQPVYILRANLPQLAEDTSSGQSSPSEPCSNRNISESECSEGISGIDLSQVIPGDLPTAPVYNPSNLYSPTIHLGSNIQYQTVESPANLSTSTSESKRKRESSAGMRLVDRTRPTDMAHYPYPENSTVQPIPMGFFVAPNMSQGAVLPITQPLTQESSTEPMLPYTQPYYFNY